MSRTLFVEKMKLTDLISANYRLLYVLPCFGIGLGFGERTVRQICDEKKISAALFLLVCNVYTFDDYIPDTATIGKVPLADLMKYLQSSHKDYLEKRMPRIINRIFALINSSEMRYGEMFTRFCDQYRAEVIAHFKYEEQVVFPYITALLEGGDAPAGYNIKKYESNHSDLDAALSDLKNIIMKYFPEAVTMEMSRDVLIDLFLFESDLDKHTVLEDQILVSLVERMENNAR